MAEFDEATLRQCFDELDADKSGSVELKDIKQIVVKANLSEDASKKVVEVRILHLQIIFSKNSFLRNFQYFIIMCQSCFTINM